jgi:SNF2 family DNA or RNA helicase
MEYNLQMTFIPNLDEQGKFFIWLSDKNGAPQPNEGNVHIKDLLATSPWGSFFLLEESMIKRIILEHDEEHIEVEGLLIPMWPLFQLLKQDNIKYEELRDDLHFGEAFLYWERIAKSIDILIRQGHYYPTLLTFEKEGNTYALAHWMLHRAPLYSIDLINEWLRALPSLVFSAVDLAPLPIRQWMDVLLDTWTDQVLRNLLAPTYAPHIEDWPNMKLFQRHVPQWFYYLMQKQNSYFMVTSDPSLIKDITELEKDMVEWQQALIESSRGNPSQSLIQFKRTYMQTYIEPLSLILYFEPRDELDPFSTWSNWNVTLRVKTSNRKDKHISIIEAENMWFSHPYSQKWLSEKIDHLLQIENEFDPLLYQKYQGDFLLQWTAETVISFYQEHAQDLEEYDIEVQFPDWLSWTSLSDEDVDIILETSTPQDSTFSLSSIVQFDWKISIGDISLPVPEFMNLVKNQQRFLQVQGEWVELPFERMLLAYEEMNEVDDHLTKKGQMSDLLRLVISEKQKRRKHLQVDIDPQAGNYLKKLVEKPTQTIEVPTTFQGELRPYQHRGFSWLSQLREKGVGGCLADDMGLGKTIQAIVYLLQNKKEKQIHHVADTDTPPLIICPTSLIGNWQRELNHFAPGLQIYAHHGPERYDRKLFLKHRANYDVMITSYAIVGRDASWLCLQEWPILIIDEAQAIKNPTTKQSKIIRSLSAAHRIALTGTPMENRLEELWSIMDFLNPGYLGSLRGFRKQFITPIEKHRDQEKSQLLKKLIQPFLLRRTKTDSSIIQDLPQKIESKELCYLSKEQASLYQSVVEELMLRMSKAHGIERKGLILAALTRLKQICDHPYLLVKGEASINHSGKLKRFFELVEPMLEQDQSALVFTQYVGMGELLRHSIQKRFNDCPVFFLHGGISSMKREEMIDEFRQFKGKKAVFILSLKAGGVGLNLTEANHVIHYDRWWNPAVEDQATDRAHRIGQQKNVHVYKLMSEGTLEEGIDQLIDRKRNLTDQIIGQSDGWVTELSNEEVYELIRLREKVIS